MADQVHRVDAAAPRRVRTSKAWGAALAVSGLLAGIASAQAGAERHHWWRDAAIAELLALTPPQQTQLDAAFAKSLEARRGSAPQKARMRFQEALAQGDAAAAREALDAWAAAEQAQVRAGAALKLEAMEQLSAEQWRQLATKRPDLLRQGWTPRPSWAAPGTVGRGGTGGTGTGGTGASGATGATGGAADAPPAP